jgi:hypothetical protein
MPGLRPDTHRHFSVLGLNPGASANDIRAAYRRKIQEWHPDRFAAGSLMQTTAEDQTKEFNEAYEWLYKKRNYRRFLRTEAPIRRPARPVETRGAEAEAAAKPAEAPEPAPDPAAPRPSSWSVFFGFWTRWRRMAWVFGATAGVFISFYLIRSHLAAHWPVGAPVPRTDRALSAPAALASAEVPAAPIAGETPERLPAPAAVAARPLSSAAREHGARVETLRSSTLSVRPAPAGLALPVVGTAMDLPSTESPARSGPTPNESRVRSRDPLEIDPPVTTAAAETVRAAELTVHAAELDERLDAAEAELDTFEAGDSIDRVKIIQGPPDESVAGAFRYGSSLVYFENGRVSGWIDGVPRLRVPSLSFADVLDEIDAFTLGSTRGEVFRIQGMPDRVSAAAYTYGTDTVYFGNDRVVNWTQTDERLRNRFLPALPYFDPSLPR